MGKSSSSKSKKKDKKQVKKKGPKGKKARAKAKLQRQWGEEAKDLGDELQRGLEVKAAAKKAAKQNRHRLQQQQQQQDAALEWNNDSNEQNDDSTSSSDGDDDDDDDNKNDNEDKEASISSFLATIQKKTKRKRQKVQHADIDDEEDHEEDEDEEEGTSQFNAHITVDDKDDDLNETVSNNVSNDMKEQDIINNSNNINNNNIIDPFLDRFSQPPLPEKEVDLVKEMKRIHQIIKVPISITSTVNKKNKNMNDDNDIDGGSGMELQLSKVWMEKHVVNQNAVLDNKKQQQQQHDFKDQNTTSTVDWKDLSTCALACNRNILKQNWIKIMSQQQQQKANIDNTNDSCVPFSVLYPLLASYTDILYPNVQDFSQSSTTQHALCLHILNHVMTTRTRIFKHNRKLKQLEIAAMAASAAKADEIENGDKDGTQQQQQSPDDDSSSWSRDQGFTRPTVLVLLPTGGTCYTFVKTMLSLLSGNTAASTTAHTTTSSTSTLGTVDNLERFETEYGPQDESNQEDIDEEVANMTPEQKLRRKKILQQKGSQWLELFADEVNDNDDFKMGIAIQPKGTSSGSANYCKNNKSSSGGDDNDQPPQQEGSCSVKLYADFYKSDIIVASPLGLKMSLTAADNAANGIGDDDDDDDGNNDNHNDQDGNNRQSRQQQQHRRADFLSSIEICLLARADVMYMQNWDHVQDVLERVNQPLENSLNVDFARVRPYHLAGQGRHWRQLIICSAWSDPLLSNTFSRHAQSVAGLARIRKRISTAQANMAQVLVVPEIKQVFQRIATTSVLTQSQDRIEYFCQHLLPRMIRQKQSHTMIFVPNYLEFVSLRNRLLQQQEKTSGTTASTYCDFVAVTEYSRISETSRGRARFIQGRKAILLYTGRAHFFHRHLIKGARHLIFFGLPEYANFYSHHVNLLNDAVDSKSSSSSTKRDGDGGDDDDDDENGITLSCTILFTKYESHALERIVGTNNCKRMVGGEKSTFFFVS